MVDEEDCSGRGGGSGGSPITLTFPGSFFPLSDDPEVGRGSADDKLDEPDFRVPPLTPIPPPVCCPCGGRGGGDRFGISSLNDESIVNVFPIRSVVALLVGNAALFGLEEEELKVDSAIDICFKIWGDFFFPSRGELVAGGNICGT